MVEAPSRVGTAATGVTIGGRGAALEPAVMTMPVRLTLASVASRYVFDNAGEQAPRSAGVDLTWARQRYGIFRKAGLADVGSDRPA
jgi:hypothetical protein